MSVHFTIPWPWAQGMESTLWRRVHTFIPGYIPGYGTSKAKGSLGVGKGMHLQQGLRLLTSNHDFYNCKQLNASSLEKCPACLRHDTRHRPKLRTDTIQLHDTDTQICTSALQRTTHNRTVTKYSNWSRLEFIISEPDSLQR